VRGVTDQDYTTNAISLLALFAAFITSLGVCSLAACTWNWLHGRGFRE